jgi:hypothetical protein
MRSVTPSMKQTLVLLFAGSVTYPPIPGGQKSFEAAVDFSAVRCFSVESVKSAAMMGFRSEMTTVFARVRSTMSTRMLAADLADWAEKP